MFQPKSTPLPREKLKIYGLELNLLCFAVDEMLMSTPQNLLGRIGGILERNGVVRISEGVVIKFGGVSNGRSRKPAKSLRPCRTQDRPSPACPSILLQTTKGAATL